MNRLNFTIIPILINIILVSWPVLYFLLWQMFGYSFAKRKIRLNTLFYVSREELWNMLYRGIFYHVGIPMTIANALVYSMMYYNATGLTKMGDKLLVIYLFLFGLSINLLYTSVMLGKHCFTIEKKAGYKILRILGGAIVIFQFVLLDGYILMSSRLSKSMTLLRVMGRYGLIGFIVEILILIIILIFSHFFIKIAKKLFFGRDFPIPEQ